MRVVVATGLYFPDIGGPATYSKLLAEALPKQGIEVDVVSFGTVRHLPRVVRHIAYFWYVWEALRHADLVYAQDPFSVGLPSYFASLFSRKPLLLKVVGDYAWEQGVQRFGVRLNLNQFVERYSWNPFVFILQLIERLVAKHATRVIVPSLYLKRIIAMWGVEERSIVTIYNAFEGIGELESKETLRKKLGLEGTVLLSSGRLVPWKGFIELIRVMPALLSAVPNLKLLIIGEGPERSKLLKEISAHNLEGSVHLMHRQPKTVLLNYIRAADVFTLNSSYEGFSHLLLEVMAVGTPIVTTNVGGNSELISDKQNGLLIPFGDGEILLQTLRTLLLDASLQASLAAAGKEAVASFSEDRMIGQTIEVIKTVCVPLEVQREFK